MTNHRRRWTGAAVIALAAMLLTACSSTNGIHPSPSPAATAASTKPNIVFVLTDDLSMNLISHMPHVEALQQAGRTMGGYYVVDSLCCPSRSAIFTGEYPHDDGVFTNSGDDGGYDAYNSNGDARKSFAVSLQKAGYTTGFMGKYLNGYQPTDPAAEGWDTWDVAGNGYPEFGYTLNENGKQVRYGHTPKDYLVDQLSAKGGSFIDASAKSGKPFMLEVATFAPHAPYTPAPRYARAAKGVTYPKSPAYDASPTDPVSWLADRPPLTTGAQKKLAGNYDKRIEADMAVDDMIGHLESRLRAAGVAQDTDIVFSSDNGYHMGEYRLLAGKQTAFDTDVHVPLIVTGPGIPADTNSDALASNIDLAATFESIAGRTPASTEDGVSLLPVLQGRTPADWQQAVLVEHHGPDDTPGDPDAQSQRHADPPSYEAVRTADALYVIYADGEQEYYDTRSDPDELHNIAAQGVPPALPTALRAMQGCHDATACQAAARLST